MARVIKNKFSEKIKSMELNCVDLDSQKKLLNSKREMKGIFEGNIENGMLEASQNSGLIKDIPKVKDLMNRFKMEIETAKNSIIL